MTARAWLAIAIALVDMIALLVAVVRAGGRDTDAWIAVAESHREADQ